MALRSPVKSPKKNVALGAGEMLPTTTITCEKVTKKRTWYLLEKFVGLRPTITEKMTRTLHELANNFVHND